MEDYSAYIWTAHGRFPTNTPGRWGGAHPFTLLDWSAVHNVAAIASGIVRAGADIVMIDGFRGGTGAAPMIIRDHAGIPIELALAAVDERLRQEGIRNRASILVRGSIRQSADVVKAIALGADACVIGTASLIAMGCRVCQKCYTGDCAWGIATQKPELVRRLNAQDGIANTMNAGEIIVHGNVGDIIGYGMRGGKLYIQSNI